MAASFSQSSNIASAIIAQAAALGDTFTVATPIGLYIGTGGTLNVRFAPGGDVITFVNVPNGSYHPLRVYEIVSADTTVDDIVALF